MFKSNYWAVYKIFSLHPDRNCQYVNFIVKNDDYNEWYAACGVIQLNFKVYITILCTKGFNLQAEMRVYQHLLQTGGWTTTPAAQQRAQTLQTWWIKLYTLYLSTTRVSRAGRFSWCFALFRNTRRRLRNAWPANSGDDIITDDVIHQECTLIFLLRPTAGPRRTLGPCRALASTLCVTTHPTSPDSAPHSGSRRSVSILGRA